MRWAFVLACTSLALSAAAACANSDDLAPLGPPNDPATGPLPEAGSVPQQPKDAATPIVSSCSDAGWCATSLPDSDLTLKDIWPFESRAFAIAESETLGVKVLEWDDAGRQWNYIDDDSQNAYGSGKYAGKIWAPSENELYYGSSPAFIYHGKRSSPSSPWTWERSRLEDHSRDAPERDHGLARSAAHGRASIDYAALGVWGTSAEDVYAWYANTIFHWKSSDGGAPTWVAEYTADDAEILADTFFIFGASGSGRDDVWFAGGRARHDDTGTFRCPIAIHKTAEGYQRLVDHLIDDSDKFGHNVNVCQEKQGALSFGYSFVYPGFGIITVPWTNSAWLTNIESVAPDVAVGIAGGTFLAYVASEDGGSARFNYINVPVPHLGPPTIANSVWVHDTQAWISGWGLVIRMENDPGRWSTGLGVQTPADNEHSGWDSATYGLSTTVLNGAPLEVPLHQVRGTSNTNLWAIGARYALHKTTP